MNHSSTRTLHMLAALEEFIEVYQRLERDHDDEIRTAVADLLFDARALRAFLLQHPDTADLPEFAQVWDRDLRAKMNIISEKLRTTPFRCKICGHSEWPRKP